MYVQRQKLELILVMTDVIKREKKDELLLLNLLIPVYKLTLWVFGWNILHNTALEKIHVQAKRKEPAICPNLQNINLPSLLIRWVNEIQFDIPSPTRDWSGVFINLKML